jgi:hypothetical protein
METERESLKHSSNYLLNGDSPVSCGKLCSVYHYRGRNLNLMKL